MKTKYASLYVIGTELTRGIISDSHIPFLSSELTKLGYIVRRAQIVPDDGSIKKGLEDDTCDSDVILVTGGLGPTSDDMTRNIIADLADVPLVCDKKAWDTLYKRIGERIHGANEVQTMIPEGFTVLENPNGTACGFRGTFTKNSREISIVSMPGPPAETRPMFYDYVKPFLASLIGTTLPQRDEYSVFLVPEAKLEELCRQCAVDGVSWGTRFQTFSISLYVNGDDKNARIRFIENLKKIIGKGLIAEGDDVTALSLLTDYLKGNKLSISCAESCTGGLIAKLLTDQAGSSDYFWGSCVTYSNNAKNTLINVNSEDLDKSGAVSEEIAVQMAQGINNISGSSVSVSVTGIAGPGGEEDGKPVGTIYIGLASKFYKPVAVRLNFNAHSRDAYRRKFAVAALLLTLEYLTGHEVVDTTSSWLYI